MPNYRLYRLDGAGKIATAEWVEAADDEAALAQVRDVHRAKAFELWERNRLVARAENGSA